ncbi:MAG: formate dehydrogenase subunit gamma [Gemmatimonadales bacterium]|nr:formate dehydrogenase subunit gamma [Gemmatimonadales bacterium]
MPPETTTDAPCAAAVQQSLDAHKDRPGALLPILHEIQHHLGYVPPESVPVIADALNLSRAEVHGVVTFYHDFRDHPAGRHVIKVCLAESCQAVGCEHLAAHARQRLGIELHGTTADGAVTLEPVYCLGNCALSPALLVDGEVVGRVTPARFDAIVAGLRRPS